MTVFATALFIVSYLVGLAGVIVPLLPGVPLVALGALLYGLMTGFVGLSAVDVWVVAGLAVLAQVLDYLAGALGAQRFGSSRAGLWGSVVGSLLGLFFFPPLGFLLGALVGAVVAEVLVGRAPADAFRAGIGALVGTLGGVVVKLFIVIGIGIFVFPRIF